MRLNGRSLVMSNLNKELGRMTVKSGAGMRRVMILIRGDMESTPPLVPLDTGNLRASWFNDFVLDLQNGNAGVVFGFSANYAAFVHEMVDTGGSNVKWKRPGSGPKFLEAAIKRNTDNILQILGESVR